MKITPRQFGYIRDLMIRSGRLTDANRDETLSDLNDLDIKQAGLLIVKLIVETTGKEPSPYVPKPSIRNQRKRRSNSFTEMRKVTMGKAPVGVTGRQSLDGFKEPVRKWDTAKRY